MPSKKQVIKIYVSPEEYEGVHSSASQAGLSLSTFAKRVCLGSPVASIVDHKAVLELMRVNADLARLGNLLKALLNIDNVPAARLNTIMRDIENTRQEIRLKIKEINPLQRQTGKRHD